MADRLIVDLDGLDELTQRLRRLKEDLDGAQQSLSGHADVLGDARVSAALERFEEHWRDGRKKVSENTEALTSMVAEAVKTYRAVDEELRSAMTEVGSQLQEARRTAAGQVASAEAVRQ